MGWDELLPEEEREEWVKRRKNVPKLSEIQMNRCYKPKGFGNASFVQIYMISDTSRVRYASVGYLRMVNAKGVIHAAFVIGKAEVSTFERSLYSETGAGGSSIVNNVKCCYKDGGGSGRTGSVLLGRFIVGFEMHQ